MRTSGALGRAARWFGRTPLGRSAFGGVALAAVATALIPVVRRRRARAVSPVDLPEPGPLAAETAVSVHNAAKSTVLRSVRAAEHPDEELVADTVRQAVLEGAEAGADLAVVIIGVVEAAAEAAPLLGAEPGELVSVAALAAVEAAAAQGEVAGVRARDLLAAHLSPG